MVVFLEALLLEMLLDWAIDKTISIKVKRIVDRFNDFCVQFGIDKNGDGILDDDEVITTVKNFIPDLSDGYTLCNSGSDVGIGYPVVKTVDSDDVVDWFSTHDEFLFSGDVVVIDMDRDGDCDDFLIPLGYDVTGDNVNDWGWLVDDNDDGLPDASPDAPFYPVGSDEYSRIVSADRGDGSIIIMSGDGTMSVFDFNGDVTAEDCDTAYALWVSENGIMNKPLDYYTVTEGLLLIAGIVACFGFVFKMFRRMRVM